MSNEKMMQLNLLIESILTGNMTLDECLSQHPELSEEDIAAVVATSRLVATDPPPVRPDFEAELKRSIVAEARRGVLSQAQNPWRARILERLQNNWIGSFGRLAVVFGALSVVTMGLGLAVAVAASSSSLPGSPLYSVKLASEAVRIGLSANDGIGELEGYLRVGESRLREIKELNALGELEPGEADLLANRAADADSKALKIAAASGTTEARQLLNNSFVTQQELYFSSEEVISAPESARLRDVLGIKEPPEPAEPTPIMPDDSDDHGSGGSSSESQDDGDDTPDDEDRADDDDQNNEDQGGRETETDNNDGDEQHEEDTRNDEPEQHEPDDGESADESPPLEDIPVETDEEVDVEPDDL